MKELINFIISKHKKGSGIDVNAPKSLSEIREFEKEIGFDLPKDFIEFYSTVDGFHCVEDIFNMIPLDSIMDHPKDYGKNWFYFSEYMIYSDMWGLRYTKSGQYEIFNGSYPDKTMTKSLYEFLDFFLVGNVFDGGGIYEWQKQLGIE